MSRIWHGLVVEGMEPERISSEQRDAITHQGLPEPEGDGQQPHHQQGQAPQHHQGAGRRVTVRPTSQEFPGGQ